MGETYRVVSLGTMAPVLSISTKRMYGRTERRLWGVEKGVSQCTARLCIQTTSTGMLIGKIQSMRTNIECV